MAQVLGMTVNITAPPADTVGIPPKFAEMFNWLNHAHTLPENQDCELSAHQALLPEVMPFPAWLETLGRKLIADLCA